MRLRKRGSTTVGAFAVHGYCGVIGAMTVGVVATGYPQGEGIPVTGFLGQLVGGYADLYYYSRVYSWLWRELCAQQARDAEGFLLKKKSMA